MKNYLVRVRFDKGESDRLKIKARDEGMAMIRAVKLASNFAEAVGMKVANIKLIGEVAR